MKQDMVRHLRDFLRDTSVNLKYRKINVFEAFTGMLDCSSIPVFLCKRLCLKVGFDLWSSFSFEKYTPLNMGLKRDKHPHVSLWYCNRQTESYECFFNKDLTNRSTKYPHILPIKFKIISSTSKLPIFVKS